MTIPSRYRVTVLALAMVLAASLLALVVVVGLRAGPAQAQSSGDTPCVGTLTGMFENVVVPPGVECTLTNSLVTGNVKVLENSKLRFGNNEIRGDLIGDKAEVVDSLDPPLGAPNNRIGGNVEVVGGNVDDLGSDFELINDTVGGNVKVENVTGDIVIQNVNVPNGNIQLFKNLVTGTHDPGLLIEFGLVVFSTGVPNGDVQVFENQIAADSLLALGFNSVGSDMQVFKNEGPGAKFVVANTIRENLQCFENDPLFEGIGNVAQKAEGQCATPPAP